MVNSKIIGNTAEDRGARYLRKCGYRIVERNFISRYGEVDLIAKEKKDLVFVEVKFRSSNDFGMPEEYVDKRKQLKIIKTALQYIKSRGIKNAGVRFDVLTLCPDSGRTKLIRSAFESPSCYNY